MCTCDVLFTELTKVYCCEKCDWDVHPRCIIKLKTDIQGIMSSADVTTSLDITSKESQLSLSRHYLKNLVERTSTRFQCVRSVVRKLS